MTPLHHSPSVAVVFATMDRATTAVACVEALKAQTLPPAWVIVADNVSSDDTVAELEKNSALPFELIVHRMTENRGLPETPRMEDRLGKGIPPDPLTRA